MKTYFITVGIMTKNGKEKSLYDLIFDTNGMSAASSQLNFLKESHKPLILDQIETNLLPYFEPDEVVVETKKSNVINLNIGNTLDVSLLDKADIEFLLDALIEEIEVISPESAKIVDSLVDKITVKKQVISHKDIN